jgi:hypothetical protein
MLIGVGGSVLAAVLFFALGWGPLAVISLVVAALSFWGFGVAANFHDDPQDSVPRDDLAASCDWPACYRRHRDSVLGACALHVRFGVDSVGVR